MKTRLWLLPLNSTLARFLVPWFVRARISANAVTILSLLCGLSAGYFLSRGTSAGTLWGAGMFLLANLLDECDGAVARLTNSCSALGALLDTLTDCIVHVAFFLGLGLGITRVSSQVLWLFLGMIAAGGSVFSCVLDVGGITPCQAPGSSGEMEDKGSLAWTAKWLRIDFSLLVLASALLGRMGWILWAGALGVFLVWIPSTFIISARQRK